MRLVCLVMLACLFCFPSLPGAAEEAWELIQIPTLDTLLENAISRDLISGGVVVIGNSRGILHSSSRGLLSTASGAPPLNEHTIFDIASLTKVVATTPAVMLLLDKGQLNLTDPIVRWFPEFAGTGRNDLTLLHLLTHTSGLEDFNVSGQDAMDTTIRRAAGQKTRYQPGSRFKYADINFILLGELVRRVSGLPLDEYCRERIYAPLNARETMFLPPAHLAGSIAPTTGPPCGTVQDHNARRLGGVAGHAGLFSSAYDLARYARMILGSGVLEGTRILSDQAISRMSSPYLSGNGAVRGLGWDMLSPFSAPRGMHFSEKSFGHTGYSGSSIWIDPQQDLFVILLTNRLNYRDTGTFNQLRRDVSTVAAATFILPGSFPDIPPVQETEQLLEELIRESRRSSVQTLPHNARQKAHSPSRNRQAKLSPQQRSGKKVVKTAAAARSGNKRRS